MTEPRAAVLVLGGLANTLALLRGFRRRGIAIEASVVSTSIVARSRYCSSQYLVPEGKLAAEHWEQLLLHDRPAELRGALLFPCSDEAIEFIGHHHQQLSEDYLLDGNDPIQRMQLLDKQKTLELAVRVGVPTPRFWVVSSVEQLQHHAQDYVFPLIVKPRLSHVFQGLFGGRRYLRAENLQQLVSSAASVLERGLELMVCEFLDGPDDLACSYYTYRTATGEHLFHYTKRVLRRATKNEGGGTYHVSEWLPEVAALGQRFFDAIELRGLGNIEFKRDLRDGKLKVIEVNPRFTAAQGLIAAAGVDMPYLIYRYRVGERVAPVKQQRDGLSLWLPVEDFRAFRGLRRAGELSTGAWLASVVRPHVLPHFDWADPAPAAAALWQSLLVPRLARHGLWPRSQGTASK